MYKKGFAILDIVVVVSLVLFFSTALYFYNEKSAKEQNQPTAQNSQQLPINNPSITIISPTEGETLLLGSSYKIKYKINSFGDMRTPILRLHLLRPNSSDILGNIQAKDISIPLTSSEGEVLWKVGTIYRQSGKVTLDPHGPEGFLLTETNGSGFKIIAVFGDAYSKDLGGTEEYSKEFNIRSK
jgi:hypothetical protein